MPWLSNQQKIANRLNNESIWKNPPLAGSGEVAV
jgi:hypothetical protein